MLETEAIIDLFRFAVLLSGKRAEALGMVARALAEAAARATQFRAQRHRWIWTARWLWDHWRKPLSKAELGAELGADLEPFFVPLPLLDRAALALRTLNQLEMREMAQILHQNPRDLKARLTRLFEARQAIGLDETQLRDAVAHLKPSSEEYAELLRARLPARTGRGRAERVIGLLSVVIGVLFLVGFLAWEHWRSSAPVVWQEQIAKLLELNESGSRAEFEPLEGSVHSASDWLYLHGIEGIEIPEPLRAIKPVAGRMMSWHGGEVAQLLSEEPRAVLLVLETALLAENAASGGSSPVSVGGWSVQSGVSGRYLFLLAVPRDIAEREAAGAGEK